MRWLTQLFGSPEKTEDENLSESESLPKEEFDLERATGASIVSKPDDFPGDPLNGKLHFASFQGNAKWIAQLIKDGADVNSTDPRGITPLDKLVFGNHKKAAKSIRDAGGNHSDRAQVALESVSSAEKLVKVKSAQGVMLITEEEAKQLDSRSSQSESPGTWTIINDNLNAVPGISLPNYEVSPIIRCRHSDPNIGEISFDAEITCRQCNWSGPFSKTIPISDVFWGRSRNMCPRCNSVFYIQFDIRVGSDGADVYFYTDTETSGTMASTFKYPLLVIREFR
jgi:hypothetical protein